MELHSVVIAVITALLGLVGLFGWSHRNLRKRMDDMEMDLRKRVTLPEARMVMDDKLAPIQVEYKALSHRIQELRHENRALNKKIDRLIEICSKIAHEEA